MRAHGHNFCKCEEEAEGTKDVFLRNGLVIKSFQLHCVERGSSTVDLIVLGFGQCTILVFSQTIYRLNWNADR